MSIFLGNLTIEQIEERAGIVLSDDDRKYMKANRQEKVNDTPIDVGKWHGFDIPFAIMVGDKETATMYNNLLSKYDWSKCKEPLRIMF